MLIAISTNPMLQKYCPPHDSTILHFLYIVSYLHPSTVVHQTHTVLKTNKDRAESVDKKGEKMAVLLTPSKTLIGRHVPDLKRKRHRSGEDGLESGGKFAKMTQSTLMDRRNLKVHRFTNPLDMKRVFRAENLHCDYFNHFYSEEEANTLLLDCEDSLEYFTGDLAIVKLYGKNIPIPRKQVRSHEINIFLLFHFPFVDWYLCCS